MKIKKAMTVVVEILCDDSDAVQFVCRTPQGQPVEVCVTPAELQSLFLELSKSEVDTEVTNSSTAG